MKKNYKLTPAITVAIEELAKNLPPVYRVNSNGDFLEKVYNKSLLWEELTEEQKKKVEKAEDTPIYKNKVEKAKGNVLFYRPARYILKWSEKIPVNHFVNLTIEFKKGEMKAVEAYCKYVNEMTIKSIEQQRIHAKRIQQNQTEKEKEMQALHGLEDSKEQSAESVVEGLGDTKADGK